MKEHNHTVVAIDVVVVLHYQAWAGAFCVLPCVFPAHLFCHLGIQEGGL